MNIQKDLNQKGSVLEDYWKQICKFSTLTDEQEKDLSERIQAGESQAVDVLVNANLRFVVSTARRYTSDTSMMCDLINEGNIALVKAAKKYKAINGKRFVNFAVWDIRRAMEKFLKQYGGDANYEDVENPNFSKAFSSDNVDATFDKETIAEAIDSLPRREQLVIKAYFGVDMPQMTMREIGDKYGMTRERVRQIRKRALRRIAQQKEKFNSL